MISIASLTRAGPFFAVMLGHHYPILRDSPSSRPVGSRAARNGPSADGKCWQRVMGELRSQKTPVQEATARTSFPMNSRVLFGSEKRGVQVARNGPSEDSKCWQRIDLGIHFLKSWGRN